MIASISTTLAQALSMDVFIADAVKIAAAVLAVYGFTWLQTECRSLDEGILEDCGSYFCAEHKEKSEEEGESRESGNLFLIMAQAATAPFSESMGAEIDESEREDEEEETEPHKETEEATRARRSSLTSLSSEPELWRMVLSTGASFNQGPRRSFVHVESS
ncbi:expressed unknown protein [Seminavis robusta]|uniref:Uncharacterized protein n=1 Tax=Seminavis robusta TaxID=568900 RepID=A0A9N8EKI7_9STRA|nr:expressed unknown protein [Seminavis robusta]|eukprot:Sro1415_g270770.1 n/a (161) ;mRNA; f:25933-26415